MSEQTQQPDGSKNDILRTKCVNALNKLAKWRTVFAGRFFGSIPADYVPGKAYRDDVEARLLLRVEVNALCRLLIEKKVFTDAEWQQMLHDEALTLDMLLEKKFPGFKTDQNGVIMDAVTIRENKTMEGWPS